MKNSKNGNKAVQGLLGFLVLVGAILGLVAFILHFTDKKNCSEGYVKGPPPPPPECVCEGSCIGCHACTGNPFDDCSGAACGANSKCVWIP